MATDGISSGLDSADLIASLFKLIPIPIAIVDASERIVLANSSFVDTFPETTDISKVLRHEIEAPGHGVFEMQTLPLNDKGFKIVYAADISKEVELRRQVVYLEKKAAIGRVVMSAADELNNPLGDIQSYAPLVSRCEMDAAARKIFDVVFTQASRAGEVVRNLLTLIGKATPDHVVFDLNEVVRNVAQIRGYGYRQNRFDVVLDLDPSLPKVVGDPAQIEQVVLTLVMNAEAVVSDLQGRPGGVEICTSSHAGRVQLHVTDNGFERDGTGAFEANEHGLGLSVCTEIVKDHNGELFAWSSHGDGSTFTMELPVSAEPGKNEFRSAGRCLLNKSVLVIDDEIHITELIFDVMRRHGAKVQIANSGVEGYECLRHQEFDVVICDQLMPGLTGQDLYRLVEESAPTLHRRFLFITGDVVNSATKQFYAKAGVHFLRKPFRMQDLLEAVENLFSRNQLRDS